MDEAGHIEGAGVVGAIALLVIPLVTLIGHGTYIYFRFASSSGW